MEEGERAEKGTLGTWEPPSLFGTPALGEGTKRECKPWRTLTTQDMGLGVGRQAQRQRC